MNTIGNKIIHLEETNSTNIYAQDLISSIKQAEGIIVLADFQTEGRGQGSNKWESERKMNLLMSLILMPGFLSPQKQFYLSMAVCLAVVRSLEEICGSVVQIKWPNDILIDKKKIAGILIQNTIKGNKMSSSVIGIGINVNQKKFDQFNTLATSVAIETGKVKEIEEVLSVLIDKLREFYFHLQHDKLVEIRKMYVNYLFGVNEDINLLKKDGESVSATLLDISDSGELIVKENGQLITYNHDQVRVIV